MAPGRKRSPGSWLKGALSVDAVLGRVGCRRVGGTHRDAHDDPPRDIVDGSVVTRSAMEPWKPYLIGNSEEEPKDRTAECWNVNAWTTDSAVTPQTGIGTP